MLFQYFLVVSGALDVDWHGYWGKNSQLFIKNVLLVRSVATSEDIWQFLPEVVCTAHMIHDLLAEVLF